MTREQSEAWLDVLREKMTPDEIEILVDIALLLIDRRETWRQRVAERTRTARR
jgi:hypothetical protein